MNKKSEDRKWEEGWAIERHGKIIAPSTRWSRVGAILDYLNRKRNPPRHWEDQWERELGDGMRCVKVKVVKIEDLDDQSLGSSFK